MLTKQAPSPKQDGNATRRNSSTKHSRRRHLIRSDWTFLNGKEATQQPPEYNHHQLDSITTSPTTIITTKAPLFVRATKPFVHVDKQEQTNHDNAPPPTLPWRSSSMPCLLNDSARPDNGASLVTPLSQEEESPRKARVFLSIDTDLHPHLLLPSL